MQFRRLSVVVAVLLFGLVGVALPLAAQQQTAPRVTLAQFQELRWLAGAWRGSGGAYPAFFEEYRVLNDSTIVMRSFPDSTFTRASDSSSIVWRNGIVFNRSARSTSVAIELSGTSVHFVREGATRGGFTFSRQSADQWTATLHASTPGGSETVYVMRRMRP
jgi:hypothetical protein